MHWGNASPTSYIQDPSGAASFSEVQLSNLDVYGTPDKVTSGQPIK